MNRLTLILAAAALAFTATIANAAGAAPAVSLHLAAALVQHADGADRIVALANGQRVNTGAIIQYEISAINKGASAAIAVSPVGEIPVGTAFVPSSASAGSGVIAYSIDHGKTWAAVPMIKIRTADGKYVLRPASPDTYTEVRWTAKAPLPPKGALSFTYEVRVK